MIANKENFFKKIEKNMEVKWMLYEVEKSI